MTDPIRFKLGLAGGLVTDAEGDWITYRTHVAAIARLAECERDAARYRWLRAEHDRVDPLARCGWKYRQDRNGHQWVDLPNGGQLDHMIDAAMGDGT